MNNVYIFGTVIKEPVIKIVDNEKYVYLQVETGFSKDGKPFYLKNFIRIPVNLLKIKPELLYGKKVGGKGKLIQSDKNKKIKYVDIIETW